MPTKTFNDVKLSVEWKKAVSYTGQTYDNPPEGWPTGYYTKSGNVYTPVASDATFSSSTVYYKVDPTVLPDIDDGKDAQGFVNQNLATTMGVIGQYLADYKTFKTHGHALTDANITGTLPVGKGGTGATTFTSGQVLVGNGTSAVSTKAIDTTVTQSDNLVTSGAVWTAIDNLPEPMVFKGTVGAAGDSPTVTSLAVDGTATVGDTYKVITDDTYGGQAAKVGDTLICNSKTSSANTWVLIPSGDDVGDTWRNIKVNGTEKLGTGISSGGVDFVNGTNTTVSFNATGNKISINSSHPSITTSDDTTSTPSQLTHGGTFTAVTGVTRDGNGHVTTLNTATYTLPGSDTTDTKVNVTLATTTKAYLLGTSTTPTATAAAVTALADTGVYLDTTAGKLTATTFAGQLSGTISSDTTATTQTTGDSSTKVATTAFVHQDALCRDDTITINCIP